MFGLADRQSRIGCACRARRLRCAPTLACLAVDVRAAPTGRAGSAAPAELAVSAALRRSPALLLMFGLADRQSRIGCACRARRLRCAPTLARLSVDVRAAPTGRAGSAAPAELAVSAALRRSPALPLMFGLADRQSRIGCASELAVSAALRRSPALPLMFGLADRQSRIGCACRARCLRCAPTLARLAVRGASASAPRGVTPVGGTDQRSARRR